VSQDRLDQTIKKVDKIVSFYHSSDIGFRPQSNRNFNTRMVK